MKPKILISFSGGRTSAYMTYWMLHEWQHRAKYDFIVVFANTGKEREETLVFADRCDKQFGFNLVWVEYRQNTKSAWAQAKHEVVNFETASRKGEPFEAMIHRYGLVNQAFPHCTRELKELTIKSYAKSIGWKKYRVAIGIRKDEPRRLDWEKAKKKRLMYVLAKENPKVKSDINLWWSKQGFDLELKSFEGNCDFCWKKAFRKLMTIAKNNPELTEWWKEMEAKYENYIPASRKMSKKIKLPIRMYRDNTSVEDIIEDAKFPFQEAVDESKIIDKWKQVPMWEYDMDSNDGCTESCEVF